MTAPRPLSPFCARLRTKRYFFLDRPARTEEELLDGSNHCWCETTQQAVGPDGALVDPEDCRRGRACYDAIG